MRLTAEKSLILALLAAVFSVAGPSAAIAQGRRGRGRPGLPPKRRDRTVRLRSPHPPDLIGSGKGSAVDGGAGRAPARAPAVPANRAQRDGVAGAGSGADGSVQAGGEDASAPADGGSGSSGPAGAVEDPKDPEAVEHRPAVGSRLIAGDSIHVGDPVELRVTAIHDQKVTVNLPAQLDFGPWISVLKRESAPPERLDDGKVKHEFSIKLAAFKVGELRIPAIDVTYTYPREGEPGRTPPGVSRVSTEPVTLKVKSVMANEPSPKLKPNAPPVDVMEEDETAKTALIVVGAVLAGVALGLLLFAWLRKRKRRAKPAPPPRPAHEIAYEKLRRIEESGMIERGELVELYFAVSEAVREYLGNRYGFDSLEMTTTELLEAVDPHLTDERIRDEIVEFSEDCDLVKFAKYVPSREEAESVLAQAYSIVKKTLMVRPAEPAEGESPDSAPEAAAGGKVGGGSDAGRPAGKEPTGEETVAGEADSEDVGPEESTGGEAGEAVGRSGGERTTDSEPERSPGFEPDPESTRAEEPGADGSSETETSKSGKEAP
jgi:hypothetical protein